MNEVHSIPTFPDHIDRTAFGHWLSGFVDGEGCFSLVLNHQKRPRGREYFVPQGIFAIGLRADDGATLRSIQSYWGCGAIGLYGRGNAEKPNWMPQYIYRISTVRDLHGIVLPHFENYPLRSKKARDFRTWSEAVQLLFSVSQRPMERNHKGNVKAKWSADELQRYRALHDALRTQREYVLD